MAQNLLSAIATESDSQRASNHNPSRSLNTGATLKAIVKEHQITTECRRRFRARVLKAIVKEHQITTIVDILSTKPGLKAIVKEHQITTDVWARLGRVY